MGETADPEKVSYKRSLKRIKKKTRFRPRKRSQSIIIYSHCNVQDHSRTHLKDYFRLMGL